MSLWSPASDTHPADWLVERITTFGETVLSLVPSGYEAYCRIFHPAWRWGDIPGRRHEDRTPVRWSEIAAATGTRVHEGMQLPSITRTWRFRSGLVGVYDVAPADGDRSGDIAESLVDVLVRHTTTPQTCWFGVWDGYGPHPPQSEQQKVVRGAPLVKLPNRGYFLMRGPIEAIHESEHSTVPNIWWPDDRAWCVTSEIDLQSTYVACTQACCDELVAAPGLEALAVNPVIGITYAGDVVNPLPPRGA